ncbi:helix-turn-helix domain-containing protein [Paenibacillus doosanensis]|uniref:Helix-turn-helix protein n=1 Tax=Paenibacillus konkukensis TaxID=2020716 RepID=A0ABY4RYR0_9BACL|nr:MULTISPECIES: DUF1232 domain-containing protein [Paenibacillus]MCS7458578.1 helix-turn-helix domain-containing protein [Paenibacillus doosanensis]UQZ86900.1 helix-turn-helix protein [Paenibacillus konkukensis]
MLNEEMGQQLGEMLKALLKEKSLSMRKLSSLTGIDTATISRIINGKQRARLDHLQQFAAHLGISAQRLSQAAGLSFDIGQSQPERPSELHASVDSIRELLLSHNLVDSDFTTERVRKELGKYEQYALTEEGRRIIVEDFRSKVDSVNSAGPFIEQLRQMHALFCQSDLTSERRAVAGSALLYFILSADIIPDYVFPIGYLDDAIAVQMTLDRLARMEKEAPPDAEDG